MPMDQSKSSRIQLTVHRSPTDWWGEEIMCEILRGGGGGGDFFIVTNPQCAL